MCGFTGFISNNLNKVDLVKMTNCLSHRGPDAEGYYFNEEKGIGLGHKRLSIIDLSENANQPMISHCQRYVMAYNGEVYNYKEIADKIGNISLNTHSDSEVILEAFAKWGIDFLKELNGMFAISIYDKLDNKLYLFRDRLGIKPLYYYIDKSDFIFGSELKVFNNLKIEKEVDYSSLYAYLHLGYIPSNKTIYKNIFKLNSGAYLIIEKPFNIITEKYWNANNKIKTDVISDAKEAKKNLQNLLRDSIKKRLISDVPIGTFLSGGTDSSIISAIAQEVNNSPINTFSIGFKETKYNESEHAKKVAKCLGTNHHEFILTEKDALDELENIMNHFDEPFADSSALPTMLVSKMARKHVTVCLTGDGGDELFMGYGAYTWANRIKHPIFGTLRFPISKLLSLSSNKIYKRGALVFNSPRKNWKSHVFSQEQYLFSEIEINQLLIQRKKNSIIKELNSSYQINRKLYPDEQQALFDLNNYLINDLLVKVDRSSMYSSLEARVPLLDHNVVEFALNLNRDLKLKKGVQKYLLKELTYEYIPKEIMERPKWGFSIPLEKWLKNDLNFLMNKYLNAEIIKELNIINYEYVKNIIDKFNNGENYYYNKIWSLILLNKFLIKNNGK